ncbi:MAG: DUF3102 domain-containing protein [Dethiobacteria bacterium]|jgi:chromosome segregation ATPase
MNEVAIQKNSDITIERTPQVIATEINSIKNQTRVIMLQASIEIGRRLAEAKMMLPHGEWGNWLEISVDYSQRTAQNLMRIYEEYGNSQMSLFDSSNTQAFAHLSYSQAVALLGIPSEERVKFVEENDLSSMSTRELQQIIKERDKVIKEKEEIAKKLKTTENLYKNISESYDRLEKTNSERFKKTQSLEKESEETKVQLKKAQETGASTEQVKQLEEQLKEVQAKAKQLEKEANEPVTLEPVVIEKVPEEVEKELNELREKVRSGQQQSTAAIKYSVCFEALVKGFKDLLGALDEIKANSPDEYEKYNGTVLKLLDKMAERL